MRGWLFTDIYFIANDPSKPNSTRTRIISVCLINPGIYTLPCFFVKKCMNIGNIMYTNTFSLFFSCYLTVKSLDIFREKRDRYCLRVLYFELIYLLAFNIQKTVNNFFFLDIVVLTEYLSYPVIVVKSNLSGSPSPRTRISSLLLWVCHDKLLSSPKTIIFSFYSLVCSL